VLILTTISNVHTYPLPPNMATSKTSAGDEFVVVKSDNDVSPPPEKTTSSDAEKEVKEEDSKCPEILYKVQYKDFSGTLKGTKILSEPYKLKKTEYSDGEVPVIEVLYTVTIWFPTLKKGKKRREEIEEEKLLGPDGEPMKDFDERSMEEKELVSSLVVILRPFAYVNVDHPL